MRISGIYKIQSKCKPERIYIGSTINTTKRKNDHFAELRRGIHKNRKLQRHCDKYGIHDLIFSIVIGCNKENLIAYEQFYIDALNPYFNISPTAGNTLGHRCSEETKIKIANSNKGNKYCLGRVLSKETKERISKSHLGKISPLKGTKYSEERKREMSIEKKGKPTWNKGKTGIYSKETLEKMSESKKKAWEVRKQNKAA